MAAIIKSETERTGAGRGLHRRSRRAPVGADRVSVDVVGVNFGDDQRRAVGRESYLGRLRQGGAEWASRIRERPERSVALNLEPGDIGGSALRIEHVKQVPED